MLDFHMKRDEASGKEWLETSLAGKALLMVPQLNKGTAFTEDERHNFGLKGKLPIKVETLKEQTERAYEQYKAYTSELKKNIYLQNLHDTNQTLFYSLVVEHMVEMIPIIYTPIVGAAVKEFSHKFRQARGLYITYEDRHNVTEIINNRSHREVDIIVISDGEGVLGIGDQGVGAMEIPIAKLMVYSICGGINPLRTLPIFLDVGTDNSELLEDPFYLGLRHRRIRGKEYDDFISLVIDAIRRNLPDAFLQWEDFGKQNARHNLERFRTQIPSFNDDVQGTGVVTLAALLAAVKAAGIDFCEQRIIIFGAGTAGMGVTEQIFRAMCQFGLTPQEARKRFWLVDRHGLITELSQNLSSEQKLYARRAEEISWADNITISLKEVITNIKPTTLIGCSAAGGAFTQDIIAIMAEKVARPIILPLSNPTECAEANPRDLLAWTQGRAIIATGSPFGEIAFNGQKVSIAQCNNALAFPGIGLGIIVVKARYVSDTMLWKACEALSQFSVIDKVPMLLPAIEDVRMVSKAIALAVAKAAVEEGHADFMATELIVKRIADNMWQPHYVPYSQKINK